MSFSSIVNMSERARWYVVHTYSGYENKVKANIEKTVENRNLENLLLDIQVPMEEVIEEKDGKQKVSLKKKFPGYVLIKMLMTDESWYVVRNTRGVTGFVGPGSKPVPLTDEEVESMGCCRNAYRYRLRSRRKCKSYLRTAKRIRSDNSRDKC